MTLSFSRKPAVLKRRGDSSSNLYRAIAAGLWTPPVNLGSRYSAWPDHETDALIAAQMAGATDEELRTLVRTLIAQRKQLMPRFEAPTEQRVA
jgi:prophage regulatory protein